MSGERVRSTCTECSKEDDHPKHHPDDAKSHLIEGTHHLDCGSTIGCETCAEILRASGGRHGDQLTRFMKSRIESPSGV